MIDPTLISSYLTKNRQKSTFWSILGLWRITPHCGESPHYTVLVFIRLSLFTSPICEVRIPNECREVLFTLEYQSNVIYSTNNFTYIVGTYIGRYAQNKQLSKFLRILYCIFTQSIWKKSIVEIIMKNLRSLRHVAKGSCTCGFLWHLHGKSHENHYIECKQ